MALLGVFIEIQKHTSVSILFAVLRQNKMESPVAFALESCRKVDEQKLYFPFARTFVSHWILS
jgi:hypothetical protein